MEENKKFKPIIGGIYRDRFNHICIFLKVVKGLILTSGKTIISDRCVMYMFDFKDNFVTNDDVNDFLEEIFETINQDTIEQYSLEPEIRVISDRNIFSYLGKVRDRKIFENMRDDAVEKLQDLIGSTTR